MRTSMCVCIICVYICTYKYVYVECTRLCSQIGTAAGKLLLLLQLLPLCCTTNYVLIAPFSYVACYMLQVACCALLNLSEFEMGADKSCRDALKERVATKNTSKLLSFVVAFLLLRHFLHAAVVAVLF